MVVAFTRNAARVDPEPLQIVPEPDDAALVIAARADGRRFAALYRRYVDRIYRYSFRRLGSKEAAEDATSVIFSRALAAIDTCNPESFRPWLFTIAHNVIVSELRDRARRPQSALDPAAPLFDLDPGPEAVALAAERSASLRSVLAQLPEEQRRILELRVAGLSGPEIAAALGRSHGSVRVAQHRAIVRLRHLLGITKEHGNGE